MYMWMYLSFCIVIWHSSDDDLDDSDFSGSEYSYTGSMDNSSHHNNGYINGMDNTPHPNEGYIKPYYCV